MITNDLMDELFYYYDENFYKPRGMYHPTLERFFYFADWIDGMDDGYLLETLNDFAPKLVDYIENMSDEEATKAIAQIRKEIDEKIDGGIKWVMK